MNIKYIFKTLLVTILIFSFTACSGFKAEPAKPAGFATGQKMDKKERYPFHRVYVAPGMQDYNYHYNKIIIEPVSTAYLGNMSWIKEQSPEKRKEIMADAKRLGKYFEESLKNSFREHCQTCQLVTRADAKTVRAEFAIVELHPSPAFWNAVGTAAGYAVPGGGLITMLPETGSIAIEGKITDAQTGKVLNLIADREQDKTRPVDIAGLTWYSNAKEHLDDWSYQLVDLANHPDLNDIVTDSSAFALNPW